VSRRLDAYERSKLALQLSGDEMAVFFDSTPVRCARV